MVFENSSQKEDSAIISEYIMLHSGKVFISSSDNLHAQPFQDPLNRAVR